MGDLSDFQRRQNVGGHLAVASVTKMATLLCVSRAPVSKVVTTYTHHGRTSSAKRKSGQKPKLSERDHHTLKRIVSINYRSTAAQVTAELEDPFPQKQANKTFTSPRSMVELKLLNFRLLKTVKR